MRQNALVNLIHASSLHFLIIPPHLLEYPTLSFYDNSCHKLFFSAVLNITIIATVKNYPRIVQQTSGLDCNTRSVHISITSFKILLLLLMCISS